MWFDQHCHLPVGPEGDALVAEAREAGVVGMICVGTDRETSAAAIEVAARHDDVWATVGVHPHEADGGMAGIVELLDRPRVVAVGEAGLDYHYDHSPRPVQREVFATQIALANERDLPLVIHTREAWDDTFAVLDREGTPRRTVFHCFTGGPDEAAGAVERGASLSISGIVTFGSADDVRAAVEATPLASLLVETDSPYLAPAPHRGAPNRPALVAVVGERVASLKDLDPEVVGAQTVKNTEVFYGIHRASGRDT